MHTTYTQTHITCIHHVTRKFNFISCLFDNSHDLQKANVEYLEEGGKRDGERKTGMEGGTNRREGEKQCYQSSREWERRVETVLKRCSLIYTKDK